MKSKHIRTVLLLIALLAFSESLNAQTYARRRYPVRPYPYTTRVMGPYYYPTRRLPWPPRTYRDAVVYVQKVCVCESRPSRSYASRSDYPVKAWRASDGGVFVDTGAFRPLYFPPDDRRKPPPNSISARGKYIPERTTGYSSQQKYYPAATTESSSRSSVSDGGKYYPERETGNSSRSSDISRLERSLSELNRRISLLESKVDKNARDIGTLREIKKEVQEVKQILLDIRNKRIR